jgi:hypothetical protein
MSLPSLERLLLIRDEIRFLQRCRQKLPDLTALVADEVMCRAVVKNIETTGRRRKTCQSSSAKRAPNAVAQHCPDARQADAPLLATTIWLVMQTQIDPLGETVVRMLAAPTLLPLSAEEEP